ncbi:hypothetical protein A6A04_10300 [Paramagnetospirillum marisnigri]|uniref:Peptidase C45 n=1 Tax=Paramagnetospirillum marisnigri TaxID=1285242 RepID=A0A178MXG3_9PROT|nr:hypothetical protein A6A04_10300 [Paramagnetospirillum marisnigri]
MVSLAETRRVFIEAADPAELWRDVYRADDMDAMRDLVRAVMGDVRRKPSWSLGWNVVTRLAYAALYKPFGHFMPESDHFARLLDTPRPDMAGLQRLYTLAHAGCSSVMAWDKVAARMVHFRSLDWPSAPAIARASRVLDGVRADGEVAFRAVGILGMVGLLTAVKPGFSVSINFAPWSGASLSLNSDPTFLVRRLMEAGADSYAEARRVIEGWRPGAPVFISLCGIQRGEACVFEFGAAWDGQGPWHVVEMGEGEVLVQTNHFADGGPFARHRVAQAPEAAWDDPAWDAHGIRQTSRARKTLIEQGLSDAQEEGLDNALRRVFARRPVWSHETAQWARMIPATGGLDAWVRGAA